MDLILHYCDVSSHRKLFVGCPRVRHCRSISEARGHGPRPANSDGISHALAKEVVLAPDPVGRWIDEPDAIENQILNGVAVVPEYNARARAWFIDGDVAQCNVAEQAGH